MTTSRPVIPASLPVDPDEPIRVRVRGPGDLVASLPALLGYHASRSIVLVALGGRPSVIRLTMRLDIPDRQDDSVWRAVADTLARGTARVDAEQAMLVVLDGDEDMCAALTDHLRDALLPAGPTLLDAILVREGRYRSLECRDPDCCPPDGVPVPASSAVAAAAVTQGTIIRTDRDDLASEVRGPDEANAARARTLAALLVTTAAHGSLGLDDDDMRSLLDRASSDAVEGTLGLDEAVRLALLLRVGELRDLTYVHLLTRGAQRHRVLWPAVCRQVPDDLAAAPLALAALAAYLDGAGALATEAIERAVAVDGCHPTVSLVHDVLTAAIAPRDVREALARCVLEDG